MTIRQINIKLNRFGEGKEELEIPITLDDLILAIKSAPDNQSTKYLWLYINGYVDAWDQLQQEKEEV